MEHRTAQSYTISLVLAYRWHKQRSEKQWADHVRQQAKLLEAKATHKEFKRLCKNIRKQKNDSLVLQCLEGLEVRFHEANTLKFLL